MNRFNSLTKPLMWFMTLLMVAFVAGCGGGSSSSASVPGLLNSAKAINTFSLAWSTGGISAGSAIGTIDQTLKTIKVAVPHATVLTPMTATFTSSPGVSVTVGSILQVSGSTNNDFTLPLSYKVTAADGTWVTYTVLVSRDQTVTSLAVTPATGASTPKGATYHFVAIATYLDTSTDDVTTTASWTPDASGNATVGLHTGLAVGVAVTPVGTPVVITAAFGGQTATAELTVTAAALVSIDISPASGVVAVGSNFPFAATGTYTDGTTGVVGDVTTTASWTSSASGVASVQTMGDTTPGLATGVTVGTVNITADLSGVTSPAAVLNVTAAPGPNLLRTASFAVLSTGSTITNSGVTTVTTGDVGATGESISGTLTVSTGTNYPLGTEQPYVDAKADLPTVIADANSTVSFPCGAGATYNRSGDLIGVHLVPGVTCFSGAILNTGVVTLDGPGVYIIRTTGALTPAAGSSVAYGTGTGGAATDANTTVFWVVGSANITSAAGTTHVIWKGTILTGGAVTLGDSATLVNGRVLATGAVLLTNNTITKP